MFSVSFAAVLPRTLTGSVAGCGTPRDHPSCVYRTCSCFLYRTATALLCSRVCWNPDEGPLFKLTVVAPGDCRCSYSAPARESRATFPKTSDPRDKLKKLLAPWRLVWYAGR
jgi:hypothetical protein